MQNKLSLLQPQSSKHMISADLGHLCFADTHVYGGEGYQVVWRIWRPYLVAQNKYRTHLRIRSISSSGALWMTLSPVVLSEIYLLRNTARKTVSYKVGGSQLV